MKLDGEGKLQRWYKIIITEYHITYIFYDDDKKDDASFPGRSPAKRIYIVKLSRRLEIIHTGKKPLNSRGVKVQFCLTLIVCFFLISFN